MLLSETPPDPIQYKSIAIVGKPMAAGITRTLIELAGFLRASGRMVMFEADTAASIASTESAAVAAEFAQYPALSPAGIGQQADAAIVVGGDGTMLGIARQLAPYPVPLIGINQGRLGFMTDIPAERMLATLAEMLDGDYESERRTLLEGKVVRRGKPIFEALAFNDVVVARGTGAGMVELRVDVDGHFMYNQRSDGLIVATPTGSTAYSLSAGGPLLHPSLGGIVLVPIAPHALSNRPIVVTDKSEIVIEVIAGRDVSVNFDMQSLARMEHHDQVVIRRSAHTITFLHPRGWNYYDTLREKLHWNEYPSADGQLK
jgi:NAD+ kinase